MQCIRPLQAAGMAAHALAQQLTARPSLAVRAMGTRHGPLRGVCFDMDGTMTIPCIPFAEMRRQLGIPTGDVLDIIASWPPERQAEGNRILTDIETQALEKLQFMPGLVELCAALDKAGMRRALLTRNGMPSVDYFHDKLPQSVGPFVPALARDFKPYKPSPAGILHICKQWGLEPASVAMVGDSAKDDIVAGNRAGELTVMAVHKSVAAADAWHAGCFTILLSDEAQSRDAEVQGEAQPDAIAKSLAEVQRILLGLAEA